jgi:hypothetical protein
MIAFARLKIITTGTDVADMLDEKDHAILKTLGKDFRRTKTKDHPLTYPEGDSAPEDQKHGRKGHNKTVFWRGSSHLWRTIYWYDYRKNYGTLANRS